MQKMLSALPAVVTDWAASVLDKLQHLVSCVSDLKQSALKMHTNAAFICCTFFCLDKPAGQITHCLTPLELNHSCRADGTALGCE